MADERDLAQSSLWTEGVREHGHSAVWGSFYSSETKQWGYSCCSSVVRGAPCPLQKKEDAADNDSDEDTVKKARRHEDWRATKLLDDEPPTELEPRTAYNSDEDFLGRFVLYWFHAWSAGTGMSASEKPDAKAVQSAREALLPLLQQLQKGTCQKALLGNLSDFADLAMQREYSKANDVYIAITIGKATWHSDLDLGEQRAHWGQGCQLRTMQRQVVSKDRSIVNLFDTDPVVQRYVHGLKRLVTHIQSVQPSVDPSKQGHVPAPTPDASECGQAVTLNIRDSDGRVNRTCEFLSPEEAAAPSLERGLAFGTANSGGRSHPFHGIGNARGI
eukprot:gnl/TRDRNA2_/TRDRNA2_198119_c0_seq1.p1 gnl/TRDRNA2_/TRDRNA2_198119_c0~~gnl/TRDRNA2_/TRDRNA2_198119_c0_seq1.p1  ORF type:complete len:331 (+),score=58.17 gnl/TRDRNA2_/TRDRNA2_198119_c0_seq1:79-1071(+)